jgi:hypothetical protein
MKQYKLPTWRKYKSLWILRRRIEFNAYSVLFSCVDSAATIKNKGTSKRDVNRAQ